MACSSPDSGVLESNSLLLVQHVLSIRRAILETAAKQESIVVVGVTEIPTLIVPNRETRFVQG